VTAVRVIVARHHSAAVMAHSRLQAQGSMLHWTVSLVVALAFVESSGVTVLSLGRWYPWS
jgi:hypothetical protein